MIRRQLVRLLVVLVLAVTVNLGLFGLTTVLSQERELAVEISEPQAVSLVSLAAPEPPRQEAVREPDPPEPQERPEFAPDLLPPNLGAWSGTDIGVAVIPSTVRRDAPQTEFIFDSADLDRTPEVLGRINPEYPFQARERGIEGFVAVKVLVGSDGTVRQVNILKSKPSGVFDQAVRKAVAGWRFRPGEVGSEPVTAWVTTTLHFRLN